MSRLAVAFVLVLLMAACAEGGAGTSTEPSEGGGASAAASGDDEAALLVIATTSILGDLATQVVGDAGTVETLLPIGADPHGFAPSAAQAASLRDADLVVANGLDLEEGLTSTLASAEDDGVLVFHATDHLDLIEYVEVGDGHGDEDDHEGEDEHSDEGEDEHSDEGEDDHSDESEDDHEGEDDHSDESEDDHEGEDEHGDHGDEDPHVWFDPARMADMVEALGAELAAIDADAGFEDRAAEVAEELMDLDGEIATMVDALDESDRVLVTNHEVLGYFADAYGFDIAATIIPGGTTLAEPSAADLEDVIDVVTDTGVRAIFAETTAGSRIAEVVADEVGDEVTVVELFTESLSEPDGPAGTYVDMMRTNATRIVEGLGA